MRAADKWDSARFSSLFHHLRPGKAHQPYRSIRPFLGACRRANSNWTHVSCFLDDSHHRGEIRRESPIEAFLEPQLEPQVAACESAVLRSLAVGRQSCRSHD